MPAGPKVTLSVADAATAVGLSASTLRTWDHRYGMSPSLRTKGGHRRYSGADLVRLQLASRLVEQGGAPGSVVPMVMSLADSECMQQLESAAGRKTGAAAKGDLGADAADLHVSQLMRLARALDGDGMAAVLVDLLATFGVEMAWGLVIEPFLRDLGDSWQNDRVGVDVEHVASSAIVRALESVPSQGGSPRPTLLACVPEEQHSLPLLALAAGLRECGDSVVCLGARVPVAAMVAAASRLRPRSLVLWASRPDLAQAELVDAVPSQRPPIRVMVAGPGWRDVTLSPGIDRLTSLSEALQRLSPAPSSLQLMDEL